jgi:isopropylmalate/homocitrate/citramalate synthase
MATANTLAGLEAGAEGFSGTILGIGERAGNAPLEEVILALRTLYGIKLRVKTEKLLEVGRLVAKYAGIPIHVSKPILGANCFKHESGIHAAGVLAHPLIYEPIPAEWISRKSSYVFGKFSGTTVLLKAALEPYGIHPEKEKLAEILQQIKLKQSRRRGKELERFVEEYERRMEEMALSVEEVIEIAKQVMV